MHRFISLLLVGASCFFLINCEPLEPLSSQDAEQQDPPPLIGTQWQLKAFVHSNDSTRVDPPDTTGALSAEHAYTLWFRDTTSTRCSGLDVPKCKVVKGVGFPNELFSVYIVGSRSEEEPFYSLAFGNVARTEINPPPSSKESEFVRALRNVTGFRIEENILRLKHGNDTFLVLRPTDVFPE